MKKLLPILLLSAVLTIGSCQVMAGETPDNIPQKPSKEQCLKSKQSFENRLNLSEKQKEKAKKIHQKGAKQMKSIMQKKGELRKELASIKKSELDEAAKKEQMDKKIKEMKALDKKARDVSIVNLPVHITIGCDVVTYLFLCSSGHFAKATSTNIAFSIVISHSRICVISSCEVKLFIFTI